MFDPGDCIVGHLRGCPSLGGWYALHIGWAVLDAAIMIAEAGAILVHVGVKHHFQERTSGSSQPGWFE